MSVQQRSKVGYGLSETLPSIFPSPIVSQRAPTTSDKADIGTVWVDKPNDDAYILTSIVANSATWINVGGGSGEFTSITVNPGDITVTTGDIVVSAGDITAASGAINAGTTITAGTGITASTGNITASTGNIIATTGNISATAGNIQSGSFITATSYISGESVYATGDFGGQAGTNGFTNLTNTTQSTGTLSIKSTTANNGNNTGFIKAYVGNTTVYIPYFSNIAP